MFWDDFNASHDSFVVISCLRDPVLRSTIERHTAEELRDAVAELVVHRHLVTGREVGRPRDRSLASSLRSRTEGNR
jgi:hypothetical protein